MLIFGSLLIFSVSVLASELTSSANIGTSFGRSQLPLLSLPYGRWRAHHYNDEADVSPLSVQLPSWALIIQVYVFRNIRYAAPPLGELRWSKPAPPEFIPGVQDGSYGHNCIPAPIPDNFFMPGSENLTKDAAEGKVLHPE
jgi:hypothetical protein